MASFYSLSKTYNYAHNFILTSVRIEDNHQMHAEQGEHLMDHPEQQVQKLKRNGIILNDHFNTATGQLVPAVQTFTREGENFYLTKIIFMRDGEATSPTIDGVKLPPILHLNSDKTIWRADDDKSGPCDLKQLNENFTHLQADGKFTLPEMPETLRCKPIEGAVEPEAP